MPIEFEPGELPDDDKLRSITQLAAELLAAQRRVEAAQEVLKHERGVLANLEERLLPDALIECGMVEFRILDGARIRIRKEYHAGIPEARADAAMKWLRETGNDSLIKRTVSVQFGKGDDATAEALVNAITQMLPAAALQDRAGVHPQTLKAFVREQIEEGAPNFPQELFGVHVVNRAIVEQPK